MEERSQLSNRLGRYRLVSTLGQGGMGTIWLAVAGGLGEFRKLLVLKELRWDLTRNERFVEMFLDEAKLAARLNHPNVVQTLEAGEEDGRFFLSMEFLDGQPLSEVMKRAIHDPALGLPLRLRMICGALSGLHYAHELRDYDGTELQIVHRDISPQNIFVTYDGQVKVVDFGIAKAADAGTFTQPGIFKGKFAYASPEQVKGHPVDRRADVFAMGVVLWEAVTLRRFAKGKPTQLSIEARIGGLEHRLAEVEPDVEPLLSEICDRAMHVDPAARFATADELRIALEQYLVVSGEQVDTNAIAASMRSAFAGERAAMHRMIDSHLKDADLSESLVRRLRPTPRSSTPGDQDPTTVADLSDLIQSSRSELPKRDEAESDATVNGWAGALRPQRSRKGWIAGMVLAIAAASAYLLRAELPFGATKRRAPEASAREQAPAADGAPAEAPAPSPPASVVRAADAAPSVAAPAAQAPVPERTAVPDKAEARGEQPRRTSGRGRGGAEERGTQAEDLGPMPGLLFGGFDDEAGTDTSDTPVPFQGPRLEDELEPREQAAGKAAGGPEAGEDLRTLRNEQRRKLDLEDPFR